MFLKVYSFVFESSCSPVSVIAVDWVEALAEAKVEAIRRNTEWIKLIKNGKDPNAVGKLTSCTLVRDRIIAPSGLPADVLTQLDPSMMLSAATDPKM